MRHHLEILKDLETYFSTDKLIAAELENEIRASATGGELISRVGAWLLQYRKKHIKNDELRNLTTEFIDYCHFNGIRFHSWLY
jgi:hypothetical protein